MSEGSTQSESHLEALSKSVEMEDPGIEDHVSNSDEDHFSDASEGHTPVQTQPGAATPVPQTRVERVDSSVQHGEVPGTAAYAKRTQDALPDEIEVIPENSNRRDHSSAGSQERPVAPRGSPIPQTMTEEANPNPPSHAESQTSLPKSHTIPSHARRKASLMGDPEDGGGVAGDGDQAAADDFDEFVEEQDDMGDDDFGDFDDGFQKSGVQVADEESTEAGILPQQPRAPPSVPPLIDFDTFKSPSELVDALNGTLDSLFPASKDLSSLPPVEPIPDSAAIFSTERSLSLWSQLVAPPPLQPQNWVKSRIRRLFLVSLGVPVDLDEILPASKQKKLILPSIDLDGSGITSPGRGQTQRAADGTLNEPSAPGQPPTRQKTTSRRRAPTPPPKLDLSAVRRLCATTDAALNGLTNAELKTHVHELEQVTRRASALLEYLLKRRDGLESEKEAFEGVIENLVSHARRVRK